MRDRDVRRCLREYLDSLHRHDPDTRVIDELDLCGRVRVDVAVVNGYLAGYELKSESDSLRRLPAQVQYYSRVLDWATLVVAERHVDHARPLLPAWWGIYVALADGGAVRIKRERESRINPNVDASMLAQLLWREEALGALAERGADYGVRSKNRREIWQRLVDTLSLSDLRSLVRTQLKEREGWRLG